MGRGPPLHLTNCDRIMLRTLSDWLPARNLQGFGSKTQANYTSGTLWPHGEFSYGYGKRRPDGGEWEEDPFVGLGVDDVAMDERAGRPLNLSDPPNSCKWPRRGGKGITGLGQQKVKAAGYLMGEKYPRHRITMMTITLPPLTHAQRVAVVELWPTLTRDLITWVTRRLRRQGLPELICSVTEVQPKRLADLNEAYLHWHVMYLNRPAKAGNWALNPNEVRAWLTKVLTKKITGGTCGHVNVNMKRVEGEAARYLAKYMSKGRQQVEEARRDWGWGVCPRAWWNLSKPARDMVANHTRKGETVGEVLQALVEHGWLTDPNDFFDFLRPVMVDFDGVEVTLGWRGRLTKAVHADLTDLLQSL